jgi:succinate dehydrogenase / fumarate reductase iron-sulfur subunit
MSQREQQQAYDYSRCMTCGSCLEACPQVNERSGFIGPGRHRAGAPVQLAPDRQTERRRAPRSAVRAGRHRVLRQLAKLRQVCPKEIPLTRAIAEMHRATTVYRIKKWLGK